MVVLEAGQGLCHDGVSTRGPAHDGREIVVHALAAPVLGVAEAVNDVRVAQPLEPPHQHVEEMHRLFQDPRSDAAAVIAPATRTLAIGEAEQAHIGVERLADLAVADHAMDQAPLRGGAEFVADAQDFSRAADRLDEAIAVGDRGGHRLFQQHVLAGLESGHGDVGMQVIGHDDVDGVDRTVGKQVTPIEMHLRAGMSLARCGGGRFARAGDRRQLGAGRLADRLGMIATPRAVADQTETHRLSLLAAP